MGGHLTLQSAAGGSRCTARTSCQQVHKQRLPARRPRVCAEEIESLEAKLNAPGELRDAALSRLKEPGVVQQLTFDKAGCRLVQAALDISDRKTAKLLTE